VSRAARFLFGTKYQKEKKLHQMTTKCTKIRHRIYQFAVKYVHRMAIKHTNIFLLQDPQKCTQNGIFGFKINHLATLVVSQCDRVRL
jgi:hypothetical protein